MSRESFLKRLGIVGDNPQVNVQSDGSNAHIGQESRAKGQRRPSETEEEAEE